jgi:hypothetical protein
MNRDELAQERGLLAWPELARHFARGVVVVVDPQLDLLDVADAMTQDDRQQFGQWMTQGLVMRAEDEDALRWESTGRILDAIVVAPWVLVRETPHTVPRSN